MDPKPLLFWTLLTGRTVMWCRARGIAYATPTCRCTRTRAPHFATRMRTLQHVPQAAPAVQFLGAAPPAQLWAPFPICLRAATQRCTARLPCRLRCCAAPHAARRGERRGLATRVRCAAVVLLRTLLCYARDSWTHDDCCHMTHLTRATLHTVLCRRLSFGRCALRSRRLRHALTTLARVTLPHLPTGRRFSVVLVCS